MKYKTAMGKVVDMGALAAKNEKARAVGNMKVNARGDTIDSTGKVIKSATNRVNENYAKTVGNRSANVVRKPTQPIERNKIKPDVVKEELTTFEKELEAEFEDDLEVEEIKALEVKESKVEVKEIKSKEINSKNGNTTTQD
jgi:hypothetical protein